MHTSKTFFFFLVYRLGLAYNTHVYRPTCGIHTLFTHVYQITLWCCLAEVTAGHRCPSWSLALEWTSQTVWWRQIIYKCRARAMARVTSLGVTSLLPTITMMLAYHVMHACSVCMYVLYQKSRDFKYAIARARAVQKLHFVYSLSGG